VLALGAVAVRSILLVRRLAEVQAQAIGGKTLYQLRLLFI
jgi:hypothetical protein